MDHHVNQELMDPHVLGEVGMVTVALQRVSVVWGTLACNVVFDLGARAVFRTFAYSLHEQGVGLKGLGITEGADIEVQLVRYNAERPITCSGCNNQRVQRSHAECIS